MSVQSAGVSATSPPSEGDDDSVLCVVKPELRARRSLAALMYSHSTCFILKGNPALFSGGYGVPSENKEEDGETNFNLCVSFKPTPLFLLFRQNCSVLEHCY